MILVICCGVGIGAGIALAIVGLFPPPLTLRAALDRLTGEAVAAPADVLSQGVGGLRRIAGHVVDVNVRKIPRLSSTVMSDLAITGTAIETFGVKVVGYAVGLGLLAPLSWLFLGTVGIHTGAEIPGFGAIILAGAGTASPFVDLHQAATRRRRHFCHSLATYASLVSMSMSGAMGWSSALEAAATVSQTDWAMAEIAQALLWAQAYHRQPWEGLERLATRFSLPDLTDLARAMAQAGDGARIRDTLEAKAQTLRMKETSALEDGAQAVTQKMLLPGVLLMAGYGVLIFYPALASFVGIHI